MVEGAAISHLASVRKASGGPTLFNMSSVIQEGKEETRLDDFKGGALTETV